MERRATTEWVGQLDAGAVSQIEQSERGEVSTSSTRAAAGVALVLVARLDPPRFHPF